MSNPNPERDHCGCGKHHTGDISHQQIISALRTNPYGLNALLHDLSDAALTQPAPDGGWSIKQNVDHLAAVCGTFDRRISLMVNQERPTLPRAYRGDEVVANNRDIKDLLQEYASNEALLANLLITLDEAQWQRVGLATRPDGRNYELQVDAAVVHLVDHDRQHLAEIKRLREAHGPQFTPSGCVCGLHHAGDISHEQMIAELRSNPHELATMLQGLDEATLTRPAPNGGWSIKQLVGHLRDGAATYLERTELMLNEDNPTMPRMDRAAEPFYNSSDLGKMLADLAATDERFAQLLQSLAPEQWQRKGVRKSAEGDAELVVDDTAVHHVDHEREHIAEIRKLLAAYAVQS